MWKRICVFTLLLTLCHLPAVEGQEDLRRDDQTTKLKSNPGRGEETTMKTPIQKLQGPEKLSRRSTLIEALKWPGEKTEVRRETDFDDNQSMLNFLDNPKQPGNAKERKR